MKKSLSEVATNDWLVREFAAKVLAGIDAVRAGEITMGQYLARVRRLSRRLGTIFFRGNRSFEPTRWNISGSCGLHLNEQDKADFWRNMRVPGKAFMPDNLATRYFKLRALDLAEAVMRNLSEKDDDAATQCRIDAIIMKMRCDVLGLKAVSS